MEQYVKIEFRLKNLGKVETKLSVSRGVELGSGKKASRGEKFPVRQKTFQTAQKISRPPKNFLSTCFSCLLERLIFQKNYIFSESSNDSVVYIIYFIYTENPRKKSSCDTLSRFLRSLKDKI